METTIRKHHYIFAHMVLNKYAFKDPESLYSIIDSEDAIDFLRKLWNETGDLLGESETVLEDLGLMLQIGKINDKLDVALVIMPKAINPTEACFMALVPYKDGEDRKFKYYVMEFVDEGKSNICEWVSDDEYVKIIEGCSNDKETFLSKLNDIIVID